MRPLEVVEEETRVELVIDESPLEINPLAHLETPMGPECHVIGDYSVPLVFGAIAKELVEVLVE